ncbi:hypothetical protein COS54_02645 [Candidatus Shapirobacteria bacterium CG03_land_8_20_14_0_80_39_12]|uniref:OmpR/PhoB-type domain-containing protein n=1 Tax=Candidatus Shapirobacteria bacterium CG03_land_8_20_14_0_80_39_12 TaxID=1974879 RepID=A0A2M7BBU9_9BACT|nr:MAG: hypothetical protein COS54_02645 [Candidatus Shapirobacteria bacterium CG03_land_8_20_14_0_80_39_12]
MTNDIMQKSLIYESLYSSDFRKSEISKIIGFLSSFQPLSLIGLPRVGLARVLRYILTHPELLEKKLKSQKILLLEIDLNDMFNFTEKDFWQLILKRVSDQANSKEINDLYLSAGRTNDAFTFFDNTKRAIRLLCSNDFLVFLLFNRFDRVFSIFSYLFFAHLQSLKDIAKQKINFFFTLNRPLEFLFPDALRGGNLEVFSQKYFLKPGTFVDLLAVIGEFERSRKVKLSEKIKTIAFEYSGGHAQYCLLILQILENNKYSLKNIDDLFKKDPEIWQQNLELWDYLALEEKEALLNKKIPQESFLYQIGLVDSKGEIFNPLFKDFVEKQKEFTKSTGQELTLKEKKLFQILKDREGEIILREEIINFVWPEKAEKVNEWTLDQLIKRLRKKLVLLKIESRVKTVKNQGYKLI